MSEGNDIDVIRPKLAAQRAVVQHVINVRDPEQHAAEGVKEHEVLEKLNLEVNW